MGQTVVSSFWKKERINSDFRGGNCQIVFVSFLQLGLLKKERIGSIKIRALFRRYQGPVVQSVVSLTCSLVVEMLSVLVSTISNSQVFLLKNVSSFCKCKSYSHFFSKNISIYAVFNDQSFNDTLTNGIISFEQLSPGVQKNKDEVA